MDDDPEINLSFNFIMNRTDNWYEFCQEVGLNPWILNEGLASGEDVYTAKVSVFKKHGIL